MKFLIVLSALVVLAVGEGTYNSDNDNLDIDALVSSVDMLKQWTNCFVSKGPCNKVQTAFKADFPEAVQQACAKCTAPQKVITKKFLDALKEKSPSDYETFTKHFDPENKYFPILEKAIVA